MKIGVAILSAALCLLAGCRTAPPPPAVAKRAGPPAISALARWPWPKAERTTPHRGVEHWVDRSSADGTVLDLYRFDLGGGRMRLELYDQDEDDAVPFDDGVDRWPHGVLWAVRHLEAKARGPIVAAWNGLFFATDHRNAGPHGIARHVAPVVLNGAVHYNVGNHRWAFGVKYRDGRPEIKALLLPDAAAMLREFDFAAGGAQYLVGQGTPLVIAPFPSTLGEAARPAGPCTSREAGHIPLVDHMMTSRTSMGWSRDSRTLWLLIVKEPDSEVQSALELRRGLPMHGGWTVADLQAFWLALGAWGAVNVDGGGLTQICAMEPGGRRLLLPADNPARLKIGPGAPGPIDGGALMYFYVREVPR